MKVGRNDVEDLTVNEQNDLHAQVLQPDPALVQDLCLFCATPPAFSELITPPSVPRGWLQLGQALTRGARTWALVLVHHHLLHAAVLRWHRPPCRLARVTTVQRL